MHLHQLALVSLLFIQNTVTFSKNQRKYFIAVSWCIKLIFMAKMIQRSMNPTHQNCVLSVHASRASEIWVVKKNGFAAECPLAELIYARAVKGSILLDK